MKKGIKICFSIIGMILVLGIVFFVVDYNRVQKQEKPLFCIKNPAGTYMDGGTVEYFGLGYKVIDFNTLAGFDDIKIGTWIMDYNDFEEEMKAYENTLEENLQSNETLKTFPLQIILRRFVIVTALLNAPFSQNICSRAIICSPHSCE